MYFKTILPQNEGLQEYTTRQAIDYRICKSRKTWGDKTFRNNGARLWRKSAKIYKNGTKK